MSKLFSSILLLVSTSFAWAQAQPLKIEKLQENMYLYITYQMYNGVSYSSNALYILTDEGAILIDTPWDKTQNDPLVEHIRKEHNKEVKWVITTHFHGDRSGGLDYFRQAGAQTYTYELTNEILKERNEPQAEFTFGKERHFTFGQEELVVYFLGEGHSTDNTVIWFPKEKVLYGGCLIKSAEATDIGYIGDGNPGAWPATIQAIQSKFKEAKTVIPGHDAWNKPGHLENTLRIVSEYNQQNLNNNKPLKK